MIRRLQSPTATAFFLLIVHVVACLLLLVSRPCQSFTIGPDYFQPSRDRRAEASSSLLRLAATTTSTTTVTVQVGDEIGKGSYGTVHFCRLESSSSSSSETEIEWYIGKRSLTLDELTKLEVDDPEGRVQRCQYYWNVEEHCYSKLSKVKQDRPQIPPYKGSDFTDDQGRRWMLFDVVPSTLPLLQEEEEEDDGKVRPAPSLTDLMKLDHEKQHDKQHSHQLYYLQQALGLGADDTVSLGEVLDVFFQSLLQVLSVVHAQKIVHRDLKPDNVLISQTSGGTTLIDFGSAADLEPAPGGGGIFRSKKYIGLEDDTRVAISPIYAAPELFIDPHDKPENFDVFSAALMYCQLLFNFLDERTDAGFHQQLASCDWNLDTWLEQELASKVRPKGLEEALGVLAERPGLWRLLTEMFRPQPWDRISSQDALERLQRILAGDTEQVRDDGPFFQSVLETFEICEVIDFGTTSISEEVEAPDQEVPMSISRPLHFLASFKRNTPLGLVLSEASIADDQDEEEDDERSEESRRQWLEATKDALPGQVFVKDIVPGGQAEDFGIFEIGDQLQGVGELPVAERGFEKVVELLGKQPPSSKFVTLHFDRKKSPSDAAIASPVSKSMESPIYPKDSGAWSSKGRRKSQEDKFVLHEILDSTGRSVLVAGVFDGHGGTAASKLASEEMPGLVTEELFRNKNIDVEKVLGNAWDTISQDYQQACASETECVANYNEREGTLDANTGADDLIAGTTATVAALDESTGKISFLNCGDSRTLLIDKEGKVVFQTKDHTPEQEMGRLKAGKEQGLDYSIPECSVSRWWLSVGDYQYAVGRSLEGPFATSKGIVSLPDITSVQAEPGFSIVCASDGLWEVMDSDEVAHVIATVRKRGSSAGDAAKTICSMAIEKGSSDNVSAVIVHLE